jgi:hypothetical protein
MMFNLRSVTWNLYYELKDINFIIPKRLIWEKSKISEKFDHEEIVDFKELLKSREKFYWYDWRGYENHI